MTASTSTLRAAAADFLSTSGQPMAWLAESAQRVAGLVQAFMSGELDASDLSAALTGGQGQTAPRPPSKTALLSLNGVLMPGESLFSMLGFGTSVRTFMQQLSAAGADASIKSIVIAVDSPGGSVRMLPEAAALMRAIRTRKPIVVAVTGMDASAAYWISSGATTIEATPSAMIGAVGVLTSRVSIARRLDQEGIDVEVFSAGKHKAEGHEATPISADERTNLQAQVDDAYAAFTTDIAAGRHLDPSRVRATFTGRVVSATNAQRLGMIDKVALLEDSIGRAHGAPVDRAAALQGQQQDLARAALLPYRARHIRFELEAHRRALVAAAHGHVTE